MSPAEIKSKLLALPVYIVANVGGSNYALPTTHWLTGRFWDYFKAELWDDSLDKWQVRWECRDFARAFATLAQVCNARSPLAPADCDALAVGEFWYNPGGDTTKGHAINACFTDDGLIFIEPQTGLQVHLTQTEIQSCYFVRF